MRYIVAVVLCVVAFICLLGAKETSWLGPFTELRAKVNKLEYILNAVREECKERKESFPYTVTIPGAGKAYCRCTWTEDEEGNSIDE